MFSRIPRAVRVLGASLILSALAALAWLISKEPAADEPAIQASNGSVERAPGEPLDKPFESALGPRASNPRQVVVAEPTAVDTPPPSEAKAIHPIVLTGRVTDPLGHPIVTAEESFDSVSLVTASDARRYSPIRSGQYEFENLDPGDVTLGFSVFGYQAPLHHVTLRADQPVRREDIVLEPYWMLTVRILTPEGEDLQRVLHQQEIAYLFGLTVLVTVEPLGEQLKPTYILERSGEGVSRSMGIAPQGSPIDGRLEIHADPPVYVSILMRDQVLATQRIEERVGEITFTIDLAQIRKRLSGLVVRVEDAETGRPAADAWVSLVTAQSTEQALHPDAEGWIRYKDRLPGLYKVQVTMKGRAMVLREVELQPGLVADLGTIRIAQGVAIRGRFIDVEGQPQMVGACLTPLSDLFDSSPSAAWMMYVVKVDAEGRFSITYAAAGRYLLKACDGLAFRTKAPGSKLEWVPMVIDTREGPVDNLLIVAERTVEVALRRGAADLQETSFRILAANGMECDEGGFVGATTARVHLVPGAYTLKMLRKREPVREIPFVVGSTAMTIDVSP